MKKLTMNKQEHFIVKCMMDFIIDLDLRRKNEKLTEEQFRYACKTIIEKFTGRMQYELKDFDGKNFRDVLTFYCKNYIKIDLTKDIKETSKSIYYTFIS